MSGVTLVVQDQVINLTLQDEIAGITVYEGVAGISFLPDPGPIVPPGSKVLWLRPFSGSYSLIVREG